MKSCLQLQQQQQQQLNPHNNYNFQRHSGDVETDKLNSLQLELVLMMMMMMTMMQTAQLNIDIVNCQLSTSYFETNYSTAFKISSSCLRYLKVKPLDIYIPPPKNENPEQGQFTIQSGVRTDWQWIVT